MRKSSTGYLFECYIWLVNTISSGPVSRKEIDSKWVHASVNDYGTDSIPESTFHRWRNTVESLFDISIKCNSKGEYYIENNTGLHHTDLSGRILKLLSLNNLLKDCQHLQKQILFEPIPAGQEHFESIIAAMRDKHLLQLTYKNFTCDEPSTHTVESYCLKEYRQRWYLIAFSRDRKAIRHFALDRIVKIHPKRETYNLPDDFDAEEYFKNICGVTILKDKPEEIKIQVHIDQVPYFRTLPLHPSQKEIETTPYHSVFSYYLIPNEEFYREIRACGFYVVVLSPDWMCQQFRADTKLHYHFYKEISPE